MYVLRATSENFTSYLSSDEPRTKDTVVDLLKQIVAIEQSRVDREDKRLEKGAIA